MIFVHEHPHLDVKRTEKFIRDSLKESFRILLRRKKLISEQNRTNYMNFIRFTMKLFRADAKDNLKLTR